MSIKQKECIQYWWKWTELLLQVFIFYNPALSLALSWAPMRVEIGVVLSLSYIFVMASVATLEMEQRVTIVIWDLQHVSNTRRFFTRYTEFNPTSFCMYIKGDSRMTHQQSFFLCTFWPKWLEWLIWKTHITKERRNFSRTIFWQGLFFSRKTPIFKSTAIT